MKSMLCIAALLTLSGVRQCPCVPTPPPGYAPQPATRAP
jgi:hypothetical protein